MFNFGTTRCIKPEVSPALRAHDNLGLAWRFMEQHVVLLHHLEKDMQVILGQLTPAQELLHSIPGEGPICELPGLHIIPGEGHPPGADVPPVSFDGRFPPRSQPHVAGPAQLRTQIRRSWHKRPRVWPQSLGVNTKLTADAPGINGPEPYMACPVEIRLTVKQKHPVLFSLVVEEVGDIDLWTIWTICQPLPFCCMQRECQLESHWGSTTRLHNVWQ